MSETAHEINYFSMLVVGSFKYTLSESGKSPAEQLFGVELRSEADDFIHLTMKMKNGRTKILENQQCH